MITTLNCGSSSYWTHTHTHRHIWAMGERSAGVRLVRVRRGRSTDCVRDGCEREEEKGSEHVKECSFSVHHFKAAPFPLLRTQRDMFIQQRLSFSSNIQSCQSQKTNNYQFLLYTCWLNVNIKWFVWGVSLPGHACYTNLYILGPSKV